MRPSIQWSKKKGPRAHPLKFKILRQYEASYGLGRTAKKILLCSIEEGLCPNEGCSGRRARSIDEHDGPLRHSGKRIDIVVGGGPVWPCFWSTWSARSTRSSKNDNGSKNVVVAVAPGGGRVEHHLLAQQHSNTLGTRCIQREGPEEWGGSAAAHTGAQHSCQSSPSTCLKSLPVLVILGLTLSAPTCWMLPPTPLSPLHSPLSSFPSLFPPLSSPLSSL